MKRSISSIIILGICVMLSGLSCGGCDDAPRLSAVYDYPSVPPIWIVEDDPKVTIYARKDLERDRNVGKMLVIPLYMNFQAGGATDFLAIAHPFVYRPGEDIEKQLTSLGQREKLRRLIFWVPGYFPDGMGRTFRWLPVINEKKMAVVELQRCLGSEERQINAAMKTLLEDDFVVEEWIRLKPPPGPYADEPKMTNDSYDAARLVRSEGYPGRFFNHRTPENTHVLWAFPGGTRIVNRISPEEKKTVTTFTAEILEKSEEKSESPQP